MEDLPLEKITITGPTLASIIQRSSSTPSDVDGLIFGHISHPSAPTLVDDTDSTPSTQLTANITSHLSSSTISSFYDSLGQLTAPSLNRFLNHQPPTSTFLGWFVSRRKTPLRPSLREFSVTKTLQTLNSQTTPTLLLLFTTPLPDQPIHTHEYRAFQFVNGEFEPKTMDVVNIGPAFRPHYGQFSPLSALPWLACETGELGEERRKESLNVYRRVGRDQKVLDMCAEGFEVGRLSKLMGKEAVNYTSELEALYGKMLGKLQGLAKAVEKSSTKVLEQEHRNMKLRSKFAGLE